MIEKFSFTPFPKIEFGEGTFHALAKKFEANSSILILTGGSSLKSNTSFHQFKEQLESGNVAYYCESIQAEPSPEMIDGIVDRYRSSPIGTVLAVGGGSVLDAGKAIAAMLPLQDSIVHYLEGVGTKDHPGCTLPFIAAPTTAGTGSEATKNAVITSLGENGFKKSLRHNNFIPDIAVIDPSLMLSCPEPLTAACGLDAITQLLESYVSSKANPISDALAFGALEKVIPSFERAVKNGQEDVDARADMAYGALISGITLANAGLGIVHGFASPIGGYFDIPHGVVCGTLLPIATEVNIRVLKSKEGPEHVERLAKHVKVAKLINPTASTDEEALGSMVQKFYQWVADFDIPKLSHYGITESDLDKIIDGSGLKNNPVSLNRDELREILVKRL